MKEYDRARKRYRCLFPANNVELLLSSPTTSYTSVQKKSKLVRDILGEDPIVHTDVLAHVFQKSMKSPRKLKLLAKKLSLLSPEKSYVDSTLRKIAVLRTKKKFDEADKMIADLKSKHGSVSRIVAQSSEDDSVIYRLLSSPISRKKDQKLYTRKLTDEMKRDVLHTYYDEEISYYLPDRRFAGLKFMAVTVDEAYEFYLRTCESKRKVGRSTFKNLKPKNMRTIQETPLRGCKCEDCTNLGNLRFALIRQGIKGIPKNHSASIEETWCPFRYVTKDYVTDPKAPEVYLDELPKLPCTQRKCNDCGVSKYKRKLEKLNCKILKNKRMVSWKQWENVPVSGTTKSKKMKRKMDEVTHRGTIRHMFEEYMKKLQDMSKHQFSKLWQLKQFKLCKDNLRHGQILMVLDFAQNVLLYSNPEPQSCHWDHLQMTVFPIVVFYRCLDRGCNELVTEEIIHVTEDRGHDLQAVCLFEKTTLEMLLNKDIPIEQVLQFTDQCSNQFKSKSYFYELSLAELRTVRHYFGTRHGKGPSDRAAANFKSFLRKTVKAGQVSIRTLHSLVVYCKEHYEKDEKHRKVKIVLHEKNLPREVVENEDDEMKLKCFNGTRLIHSVRNLGVESNQVVEKKDVSCCCNKCQNGEGECAFPTYTDPEWERFSMVVGGPRKKELPTFRNHWDLPTATVTNSERASNSNESAMNGTHTGWTNQDPNNSWEDTVTNGGVRNDDSNDDEAITIDPATNGEQSVWSKLYEKVSSASDYENLRQIVARNRSQIPPIQTKMKWYKTATDRVDPAGRKFYPKDGPKSFVPLSNYGDGNCFPRALSQIFYSCEDNHLEVRLRLLFEGVTNALIYVSDAYLGKGLRGEGSGNVASSYCMYSGLARRRNMSQAEIMDLYKTEMMIIRRLGTEMGMWEFHIATQVFSRPIGSVYPEGTNPFVRKHTNRIILPVRAAHEQKQPVYVMWTPLTVNQKAYDVRHFVPLVKYER